MMTRSKTANATVNVPIVPSVPSVPSVVTVKTNDSTVVYPSMFDRWRLPL
jgi:hypothetical protein